MRDAQGELLSNNARDNPYSDFRGSEGAIAFTRLVLILKANDLRNVLRVGNRAPPDDSVSAILYRYSTERRRRCRANRATAAASEADTTRAILPPRESEA